MQKETHFRYCKNCQCFYDAEDNPMEGHETYPLMNTEVVFYLNRLRQIKESATTLRTLLSV